MGSIVEFLKQYIRVIVPIALVLLSVIGTWGVIKWTVRVGTAIKGLGKNPLFILLWFIVLIAIFILWFRMEKMLPW